MARNTFLRSKKSIKRSETFKSSKSNTEKLDENSENAGKLKSWKNLTRRHTFVEKTRNTISISPISTKTENYNNDTSSKSCSIESNISLEPINNNQDHKYRPELQRNMQRQVLLTRNKSSPGKLYTTSSCADKYNRKSSNNNSNSPSWKRSFSNSFTVFPKISQFFQNFEYDEFIKMQQTANTSLKRRVTFSGSTDVSLVY